MTVGSAEPEEPEDQDEYLADDDTPVEDISAAEKIVPRRGLTAAESRKLSEEMWAEYAGGMPQQEIATLHGVSQVTVSRRLRTLRRQLGVEEVEEAKALDLGRYEALIERVWSRTFKDPTPENVRSLAMLMDQRAKLLGLNAPKKLSVDGQMQFTPSPQMVMVLDRLAEERGRLEGELQRPAIEGPGEIIDAEIVDDDG